MSGNIMLAILVFYPFLGALLTWLVGRKKETVRDYMADFIVISEFAITFVLFIQNVDGGRVLVFYDCIIPEICGFGLHLPWKAFVWFMV